MNRRLLPGFFICIALAATSGRFAAVAGGPSQPEAVVVTAAGPTRDGVGAGTVVARAGTRVRVLTAKHVAAYGALTLHFSDGTSAPAHISVAIAGRDLAVIEADIPTALATVLRPAPVAMPHSNGRVHVVGSGLDGPALEPGAIGAVGAALPDGPSHGRYALTCHLCHEGDSGGGVFNEAGELVGVFVGYFTVGSGRIAVAEMPDTAVRTACEQPFPSVTVADAAR